MHTPATAVPSFNTPVRHTRCPFQARVTGSTAARVKLMAPDGRLFWVPMAEFVQYWMAV
jgi:hypothetical protein